MMAGAGWVGCLWPAASPAGVPRVSTSLGKPEAIAARQPARAEPQAVPQLRTFSISDLNPHWEGQWDGSLVASDGNLYFGVSSHTLGQAGAFFRFNPLNEELSVLCEDLSRLVGEDPAVAIQSKVHSAILEYQGWLYFATHIGQGIDEWIRKYPGGHVIGYELATGRFVDLGIPMTNHTIYAALGLDEARGHLFVQVTPASFFSETVPDPPGAATRLMRFDLMNPSAGWVDLGVLSTVPYDVAFTLYVDHRGDAWITPLLSGTTFLARHGASQVSALPQAGGWHWIHPLPGSRRAVVARSGYFWLFDPEQVNPEGPVVWGPGCFTQLGPVYGSSFGLHGNKVYMTEGNQCSSCPPSIPHHECNCDIRLKVLTIGEDDTGRIADYGLVIDRDGRHPWRLPSITGDGADRAYVLGDFFRRPEDTPEYRNGVVKVVDGHEYTMLLGMARLDVESPPQVEQALITGQTLIRPRQNYSGWVGMKLRVSNEPLRVTHLGRMALSGNTGTHRVRLVRAETGQEVASVPVAMAGASAGQYQFAALPSPVALQPGGAYYLLSEEVFGGDWWHDLATTVTTDGRAACEGPVWGTDGAWHEVGGQPNHSYGPPNLLFATVPQAGIISPTTGETYCEPAVVLIEAAAVAGQGSVTNVEFIVNGTKVGEDSTAPYSFAWSNVLSGEYVLQVRVLNSYGQSAESWLVPISVGPVEPPVLAITNPADGATFGVPANLTVDVGASSRCGSIARIEFFEGSTKLGEDGMAPYSFTWPGVPPGEYRFTARAIDTDGLSTLSSQVSITVTAAPPALPEAVLFITNHSPGTVRANFTGWIGFRFTVGDAPVELRRLGRLRHEGDLREHALKLVSASTGQDVPGSHVTVHMAGHAAGDWVFADLSAPLTLQARAMYYLVSLETAWQDQWFDLNAGVRTQPWASCDGPVWGGPGMGWNFVGGHVNRSYGLVNFALGGGALHVAVSSPSSGQTFVAPADVLIQAAASAGQAAVTNVAFFANGTKLGESLMPPYTFLWRDVPAGTYELTAQATDATGLTATSTPSVIRVQVASEHVEFITEVMPGRARYDGAWAGMQIRVGPSPLVVSSLGRFVSPGNTRSHLVKLTTADARDIPNGSVMVATAGAQAGRFAYADLPEPIRLEPGTTYLLVSQEQWYQDAWQEAEVRTTTDALCAGAGYLWYGWWGQSGPDNCWGPVNFKYSVLPAPEGAPAAAGKSFKVSIRRSGGEVILTWPAEPGRTYRLQSKGEETQWKDQPGDVLAAGSIVTRRESIDSGRFFRVVRLP